MYGQVATCPYNRFCKKYKKIMKIKKVLILAFILVTSHYSLTTPSYAINMQSNDYRIQFGKVDSGGGKMIDPVDDTYRLSSSIGQ